MRQLVVFLLLVSGGAIVNVTVAWGCVRWSPIISRHVVGVQAHVLEGKYWVGIERSVALGFERHEILWTYARGIEPDENSSLTGSAYSHLEPIRTLAVATPQWSRLGVDPTKPDLVVESEQASGWPVRSMRCNILEYKQRGDYVPNPSHAFIADQTSWPYSHVYPLGTIWPGFALNTVFYAAILWLLFAAPGFVRRRIRIKRGLCPACAYPVGTSDVCTECGSPRPRAPFARERG